VAAVELNDQGYPLHMRFDASADRTDATVAAWASLHPQADVATDGLASLAAAGAEVADYGAIIVGTRKFSEVDRFRWVDTFISNLKTAIRGTSYHFDFHDYRHLYPAEAQYRLNRRFALQLLMGRLSNPCATIRRARNARCASQKSVPEESS